MLICFTTLFPGKDFKTMCYHLHGIYFFKFRAPPICNNMDKQTQRIQLKIKFKFKKSFKVYSPAQSGTSFVLY